MVHAAGIGIAMWIFNLVLYDSVGFEPHDGIGNVALAARKVALLFSANFGKSVSNVASGDKYDAFATIRTIAVTLVTRFKVLLLGYSLVGTVVWGSYRASLTSNLSIREYRNPFSSIAQLAETDYV